MLVYVVASLPTALVEEMQDGDVFCALCWTYLAPGFLGTGILEVTAHASQ